MAETCKKSFYPKIEEKQWVEINRTITSTWI